MARRPPGEEDPCPGHHRPAQGDVAGRTSAGREAKAVTVPILTISHCRHSDDQLLGNFRTRVSANSY